MEILIGLLAYLLYAALVYVVVNFLGPKMVEIMIMEGKEEQLRALCLMMTPTIF